MINNKAFWNTIMDDFVTGHGQRARLNTKIAEAETTLKEILKSQKVNFKLIQDDYYDIIFEHITMAYMQGIEAGTQLTHLFLSDNTASHVMEVMNTKAKNKLEIDIIKDNTKSLYKERCI